MLRIDEMLGLATKAGFVESSCIGPADWTEHYFANRSDELRPTASEYLLVARV